MIIKAVSTTRASHLTSSCTSDEAKGRDEASAPLKAACFAEHTDRMRVARASFRQSPDDWTDVSEQCWTAPLPSDAARGDTMWYESMEAQRRFVQSLCEWWMPDYRWPDRPCEPPPFGISSIRSGECSVPVVESVLDRTPFCELRHFARVEGAAAGQLGQVGSTAASIFVCAPLAGHHAVMLREMVETLLQNADVYVTDWTDARMCRSPRDRSG
jgi:hypothetical protein